MNLKTGEVWICQEPCCKAEIVVRRGANPDCPGNFNIRCCCGKEMVREQTTQTKEPALAGAKKA